jgi:large subunit ribosomal protein L20
MARVKSPRRKRHKKVMKAAKGFRDARRKRYKVAKEAVQHAGMYAFVGRRDKKGDYRELWIERLNAAVREHDLSYSKFISALKKANILLNRKMLSEIAIEDENAFTKIVERAKSALA